MKNQKILRTPRLVTSSQDSSIGTESFNAALKEEIGVCVPGFLPYEGICFDGSTSRYDVFLKRKKKC